MGPGNLLEQDPGSHSGSTHFFRLRRPGWGSGVSSVR